MSHFDQTGSTFLPANFPPNSRWKYGNTGICPHWELIRLGKIILGEDIQQTLNDNNYCGSWNVMRSDAHTPVGFTTECERVVEKLVDLIHKARPAAENPIKPNKSGVIFIKCKFDDLSEVLADYLKRTSGAIHLVNLTAGMEALDRADLVGKTPKELVEEAQKICDHICQATIGEIPTSEIIRYSLQSLGFPTGSGCSQRPK